MHLKVYLQTIGNQVRVDKDVVDLVNQMETASALVEDANNSPDRLRSVEETSTALLKEIGECSIFIRKYIHKQGSFFGNVYND